MKEAHYTPYIAHPDSTKMCQDFRYSFCWDRMKKDTVDLVKKCLMCQYVKAEHKNPKGYWYLYQSLGGNEIILL